MRVSYLHGVILSAAKDLSNVFAAFGVVLLEGEKNGDHTYSHGCGSGRHDDLRVRSVAFSGTYTNGTGDTVNWQSVASQLGIAGQPVAASMSNPAYGPTQAAFTVQGGTPNQYNLSQGTLPTNWAMRGYASGGTEFSTGSYPASATNDKVVFAAQFRRLA